MDVFDKLKRILQDDFKVGVEMHSGKPLLYLNPDRINNAATDASIDKAKAAEKSGNTAEAQRHYSDATRSIVEQMDEQYPGLASKLTQKELNIFLDQTRSGPAADPETLADRSNVCVVTQPSSSKYSADKLLDTVELTKLYKPEHLKPLPGSTATWQQLIGEHEGDHCRNGIGIKPTDDGIGTKVLNAETESDRAALKTLRENGQGDVAQAWLDIRALRTGTGDPTHATSIIVDADGSPAATPEHLAAAASLNTEMNLAVGNQLGVTPAQAEELRRADPQTYATTLESAINEGKIPASRLIADNDKIEALVAGKMGLSVEDYKKLGSDRNEDVRTAYDQLKAEGALHETPAEIPYSKDYMNSYIGASRRMFTEETKPAPVAPKPELAPIESRTVLSDKQMEDEAKLKVPFILEEAVAKHTGLSAEDVVDLKYQKPQEYAAAADEVIAKGLLPKEFTRQVSFEEQQTLLARKLGVDSNGLDKMYETDPYIPASTSNRMSQDGSFNMTYSNPYITEQAQKEADKIRTRKPEVPDADAPAEEADAEAEEAPDDAAPKDETPESDAPEKAAPAAAVSSKPASDDAAGGSEPEVAEDEGPSTRVPVSSFADLTSGIMLRQSSVPPQPASPVPPPQVSQTVKPESLSA